MVFLKRKKIWSVCYVPDNLSHSKLDFKNVSLRLVCIMEKIWELLSQKRGLIHKCSASSFTYKNSIRSVTEIEIYH